MSMLSAHVHAACPCSCAMSMHVHPACPCPCPCCVSMSRLHILHLSMPILHVHAMFCQWAMSMSMMLIHAACPCFSCMFISLEGRLPIYKVQYWILKSAIFCIWNHRSSSNQTQTGATVPLTQVLRCFIMLMLLLLLPERLGRRI